MRRDSEKSLTSSGRAERIPSRRQSQDGLPWLFNFLDPFENLLDDSLWSRMSFRDPVKIDETDREYMVCVDMPGVQRSDITIECAGNQLNISSVRRSMGRDESQVQTFRRSLSLPEGVGKEEIKATYEDGVLKITVPKGEALKTRRIPLSDESEDESDDQVEVSSEDESLGSNRDTQMASSDQSTEGDLSQAGGDLSSGSGDLSVGEGEMNDSTKRKKGRGRSSAGPTLDDVLGGE